MPFDPEGSGYDYETARREGIRKALGKGQKKPHWPSRVPRTGLLLKGRKHKTWPLTVKGELAAGYTIYKKGRRYYSMKNPIEKPFTEGSRYAE